MLKIYILRTLEDTCLVKVDHFSSPAKDLNIFQVKILSNMVTNATKQHTPS